MWLRVPPYLKLSTQFVWPTMRMREDCFERGQVLFDFFHNCMHMTNFI